MGLDPANAVLYKGISHQFMNEEDRQRVAEEYENTLNTGAPYDTEYTLYLPNGKRAILRNQGVVQYDTDGKPAVMRGTYQDITGAQAHGSWKPFVQTSLNTWRRRSQAISSTGRLRNSMEPSKTRFV